MDFTKEEVRVIRYFAQRESASSNIGFYLSVLLPLAGFGAYGYFSADINVVALTCLGLLSFVIWNLSGQSGHAPVYHSIFSKISDWLDQNRPSESL